MGLILDSSVLIFVKHLLTHAEYDRKEWTK